MTRVLVQTVSPSSYSTYKGYFSRSNVARSQDCRPSTSWHRQSRFRDLHIIINTITILCFYPADYIQFSRFTFSTISSSFTRFRSTFQTFKSKYF